MNKPPARRNPGLPQLDPVLLERLLENQAQELGIRQQELILQQQQSQNSHEYAQMALDAQVKDREQGRNHYQRYRRERLYFAAFIAVLLVGFLVFALHIGKDTIALEVLKALVYLLAGGLGGYSLKNVSEANKQPADRSRSQDS